MVAAGEERDMALAESRRELGEEFVRARVRGRAEGEEADARREDCCTEVVGEAYERWEEEEELGMGRGRW